MHFYFNLGKIVGFVKMSGYDNIVLKSSFKSQGFEEISRLLIFLDHTFLIRRTWTTNGPLDATKVKH